MARKVARANDPKPIPGGSWVVNHRRSLVSSPSGFGSRLITKARGGHHDTPLRVKPGPDLRLVSERRPTPGGRLGAAAIQRSVW
jgi:hypothetical protein